MCGYLNLDTYVQNSIASLRGCDIKSSAYNTNTTVRFILHSKNVPSNSTSQPAARAEF